MKSFHILLILISTISITSNAQEIIRKQKLELDKGGQSFVLETSNPKVVVFDKEFVHFIPVDPKNEILTYNISGLYNKKIVGYSITGDSDITFYIEKKNRYIDFQLIRTEKNKHRYGRVNNKLPGNEEVISKFSAMNDFYILTISDNSSILNLYRYNAVYLKEKWSIDLSSEFENTSLHQALKSKLSQKGTISFNLLGSRIINIDNSLDLAKIESINSSKIFTDKSSVYITIDSNNNSTELITISLANKNYSLKKISYPGFCISSIKNTNSFIADNLIFSVRYCFDGIALKVSSLEGKELISWTINAEYESWNSTSLYGDEYFVNKTMSNIITTLSEGYAGIVANKVGDDILLSLGGQKSLESAEIKPGVKAFSEGWLLFPLSYEMLSPKEQNTQFLYDDYFRYTNEIEATSFQKTFGIEDNLYFANYNFDDGQFVIVRFRSDK